MNFIFLRHGESEAKEQYPHKKLLAVTHAAVIRLIHVLFGNKEYRVFFPIDNASLHEFDI